MSLMQSRISGAWILGWLLDARRQLYATNHIALLVDQAHKYVNIDLGIGAQNWHCDLKLVGFARLKWTIETIVATGEVWIYMKRYR